MNSTLPAATCSALRRSAASIIFGERSTAVRRPPTEALADERRGDTVTTADLEDAVVRPHVEPVHHCSQPLAHRMSFSSLSSLRSVRIFFSPSSAVHSASVSATNSRAIA